MATIALYANQINQTGSKLSTARKGVDSFRKELLSLRSKMGEVDRGICDLESEMADVKSTSDTQELKSGAFSAMEKAVDDFIDFADRTDRSAADYINRAKADFYKKYSWLKPESENSLLKWFTGKYDQVKEYFKSVFQKAKEFYEIKVLGTLTAIVDKLKEAWGFVKGKFEQFVAPLKQIINNIKEDLQNFNWNNTDEKIVRDSHYFSAYRETLVIRHHIPGCSSMSLGVIFLNTDENRQDTVPHEYGHTVQLDELGLLRYIVYIAIPSVKGYANNVQDYYSQPWERTADYYGGVNRNSYAPDSLQAAQDYLEYAKKPLYEKVADAAKKLWAKFSQKKAGTAGGTP